MRLPRPVDEGSATDSTTITARFTRVRVHGRDEERTVLSQMEDSSEGPIAWVCGSGENQRRSCLARGD